MAKSKVHKFHYKSHKRGTHRMTSGKYLNNIKYLITSFRNIARNDSSKRSIDYAYATIQSNIDQYGEDAVASAIDVAMVENKYDQNMSIEAVLYQSSTRNNLIQSMLISLEKTKQENIEKTKQALKDMGYTDEEIKDILNLSDDEIDDESLFIAEEELYE